MGAEDAAPNFEDVLLQAFLPVSHRSPALAVHFRRLVSDVHCARANHTALDRLIELVLDELRRVERALSEGSVKRLVAMAPRRLLTSLPIAFLSHACGAEGPAREARGRLLPARAACDARPSGPLGAREGAPGAACAPRSSTTHRAACPLRRSREEVIAQYGDPCEWQLAGRGSSKVRAPRAAAWRIGARLARRAHASDTARVVCAPLLRCRLPHVIHRRGVRRGQSLNAWPPTPISPICFHLPPALTRVRPQDVYYAECRTPITLSDGSTRAGLVAIAVGRDCDRMRAELRHLGWVDETLRADARAAGRITLPLDSWEMDGPPIASPLFAASPATANADESALAPPLNDGVTDGARADPSARFLAVVFPAGLSLLKLVQRGVTARWSEAHFASLAYEMLLPLCALCEHGAAHRDIKPENTLLLPPLVPLELGAQSRACGARGAARVQRAAGRPHTASGAERARSAAAHAPAAAADAPPRQPVVRVQIADWSTLRVNERDEYGGRSPADKPLLGTAGYQHFSFFTSAYLGPPWHPKQWCARPARPARPPARPVGARVRLLSLIHI